MLSKFFDEALPSTNVGGRIRRFPKLKVIMAIPPSSNDVEVVTVNAKEFVEQEADVGVTSREAVVPAYQNVNKKRVLSTGKNNVADDASNGDGAMKPDESNNPLNLLYDVNIENQGFVIHANHVNGKVPERNTQVNVNDNVKSESSHEEQKVVDGRPKRRKPVVNYKEFNGKGLKTHNNGLHKDLTHRAKNESN